MTDKSKRATLGRRLFVSFALSALLSIFLALYFFIYIPQQEVVYNKGTFRVLGKIADNFSERLIGNDLAAKKESRSTRAYSPIDLAGLDYDSASVKSILSDIEGKPQKSNVTIEASTTLTASYTDTPAGDSARRIIEKIFEPITSINENALESVVLMHLEKTKEKEPRRGRLIYKSSGLAIDEEINIDSLFKNTSAFTFPIVNDIKIEAVDYKLFLYPFRIQHEKFLLGGFVTRQNFKTNTHNFPVISLVILGILLISVVLSLPFLKIYLIGPQEKISVNDVRSVIAMIYVIPFFLVLLGSAIWLQYTSDIKSDLNLESFHEEVKENFYNEIHQSINQLKQYDSLYNNPKAGLNNIATHIDTNALKNGTAAFADAYLHPNIYKSLDGVFWINKDGEEIAKWNFTYSLPTFFDKNDRQYFRDIKSNSGFRLPGNSTAFSIQPTLAKSTGDYTVSVAIKSTTAFTKDTAILIGLHGKMYSVYKPVVPAGLNFCIINVSGDVLYHSQSDRGLQENLFDELDNSDALRVAVSHKENLLLNNVELHENKVKLLVKPLEGLPYFLVSYSNNRLELLYVIHIIAFSFFCESILLIIVALITLLYYYSNNKFSKLFYTENDLNFTKPSPLKTEYYKKILYYQLAILLLMGIAFIFFNGKVLLSYILYTSILLPVFSVIGYYLIRTVENYREEVTTPQDDKTPLPSPSVMSTQKTAGRLHQLRVLFSNSRFLNSFVKIIIPYLIFIWIFSIIKTNVSPINVSAGKVIVNILIFLFVTGFPFIAVYLSLFGLPGWLTFTKQKIKGVHNYLSYFILAIMISAALASVMPTLGFILFAAGQEKSLQLKSKQMYLAEKLATHHNYINQKLTSTKIAINKKNKTVYAGDSLFVDSLWSSSSKGLYIAGSHIGFEPTWSYDEQNSFNNSFFYKRVSGYLFLPAEHPDYFDNSKGFYYWVATPLQKEKKDSLLFHYKNVGDNINTSNLVITSAFPRQPSFLSVLNYRLGVIIALSVLLLLVVFYKIIYSVSTRIFLIDYFDKTPGAEQDKSYLNREFFDKEDIQSQDFDKDFWGQDKLSLDIITAKEKSYSTDSQKEEGILKIQNLLSKPYESIWKSLTPTEQFVLYDFAIDGFSNYKNVDILYSLYKKGLIKKVNNYFVIMTDSFRNFLVAKTGTEEVNKLKREVSEGGTWGNLRTVLLVIVFIIIVFLFIVQEDVSKRVFAIVTSVGAAIPIILKLFDRNLSGAGNTSDGSKK